MAGSDTAIITMGYSLMNRRINEIGSKTMTNGVESTFSIIALYYFNRLQSKFDKNMKLMTAAITLAFIVRSSSLVSFGPLALFQIASDPVNYTLPILKAGVFIALPLFAISCCIDTLLYKRYAMP